MNKPDLKGLDLRSEEVRELMGAVPSWIQRWGITAIAVILVGAITLCGFIRLPERCSVELVPLSASANAIITISDNGIIRRVMVADGDDVKVNDTLLEYADSTFATAPTAGVVSYIGPVLRGARIPAGTEIMKISKSDVRADSTAYFSYIPEEVAMKLRPGAHITAREIGTGTVRTVARSANSKGLYYIEIALPGVTGGSVPVEAEITISSDSVLHRLLMTIRHRNILTNRL